MALPDFAENVHPVLDFECGLHWEHEGVTANPSRAAARARTGGVELAAAHGEAAATASDPE